MHLGAVAPPPEGLGERRDVAHGRALGLTPVPHARLVVDAPEVHHAQLWQPGQHIQGLLHLRAHHSLSDFLARAGGQRTLAILHSQYHNMGLSQRPSTKHHADLWQAGKEGASLRSGTMYQVHGFLAA